MKVEIKLVHQHNTDWAAILRQGKGEIELAVGPVQLEVIEQARVALTELNQSNWLSPEILEEEKV